VFVGQLAMVFVSLALIAGCTSGFQFRIRNDSDLTWFVRMQELGPVQVMRVGQKTSGVIFAWVGDNDLPIELLRLDCQVVGVFAQLDGKYVVPGIEDVSGEIEPGEVFPRRTDDPDINAVEQCGGVLVH
jgi:hypothetical protein